MRPAPLERLIADLDAAVAAGVEFKARITAALGRALACGDWLPSDCCKPGAANYARHLLYGDPDGRYSILALAWNPGQGSPIHAHNTWCAVGVYRGELTEIFYEQNGESAPRPTCAKKRHPATLSFDVADNGAHRIANDGGAPAVSLHIYGVGRDRIATDVNRVIG